MKCTHCGHDVPEGKGRCIYCGAGLEGIDQANLDNPEIADNGTQGIARLGETEDFVDQAFTSLKSKRRNPVGKAAQACIFFLSMLIGGLIVWLLN